MRTSSFLAALAPLAALYACSGTSSSPPGSSEPGASALGAPTPNATSSGGASSGGGSSSSSSSGGSSSGGSSSGGSRSGSSGVGSSCGDGASSGGPSSGGVDAGALDATPADASSNGDAAGPCTSGAWGSTAAGSNMDPGTACGACHARSGIHLPIGGTVYPTLHDPDMCIGVSGATVTLTDATGRTLALRTSFGNFFSTATLTAPYSATIADGTNSRSSTSPHTDTDCNACHTAGGVSGAAGRLTY
jgi:hypothetical protein